MINRKTIGGASRNSRIQAFDGKIDGSCVPGPPSLRPDHLTNEQTKPRKRSAKRIPFAAARPLPGLKSPVRGYATALLCNARPVASGLALIRCKGKANPA